MTTFKRFEEIHAWQKARYVTQKIYKYSNASEFARDFGLRDQMRRASVSIMANIAEGHGRRTRSEFANFLNIARGSAIELQSHLYVAHGKPEYWQDVIDVYVRVAKRPEDNLLSTIAARDKDKSGFCR